MSLLDDRRRSRYVRDSPVKGLLGPRNKLSSAGGMEAPGGANGDIWGHYKDVWDNMMGRFDPSNFGDSALGHYVNDAGQAIGGNVNSALSKIGSWF